MRVLSNRLQQPIAATPRDRLGHDERLIDQPTHQFENGGQWAVRSRRVGSRRVQHGVFELVCWSALNSPAAHCRLPTAHVLGSLEIEPTGERAQTPEGGLL